MSIFKCKMCGGDLEVTENQFIGICDSCGSKQTLPKLNSDRKANLYDRANHFRRNNEFDKAMGIYENILNEDSTDAEAYWSLVLCRYGIEYVEDPATKKRVPTVNRAQFTSIFDDDNYKSALSYADVSQKSIYEAEANTINEIQKGILAISQQEGPFDVFICYKETDNNGRRTHDSVLANDLYHQLTAEGFKVFFSRITLEDKLGTAYEPYIFAALNSAKIMVVLGTKPEFFNAVWVKNEWSRYLSLVKQSGGKKILIPAYKDMDPYDLPEEFSHLQAQDMGKLGFMQDLIRGIKKLTQAEEPKVTVKETVVMNTTGTATPIAPLLERAFMYLEDGEWTSADEYCEKVLDQDPKNARAYLGKLMAELKVRNQEQLKDCAEPFDCRNNYQKTLRFADEALQKELREDILYINKRNELARKTKIYKQALSQMNGATKENQFISAAKEFEAIPDFEDADEKAKECRERAEIARKDGIYYNAFWAQKKDTITALKSAIAEYSKIPGWKDADKKKAVCESRIKDIIYDTAVAKMQDNTTNGLKIAVEEYSKIPGWKDADEQIYICKKKIEELKAKAEAERLEREQKAEIARVEAEKRAKRNKKIAIITTSIVCVVIIFVIVLNTVIIPNRKYTDAVALLEDGKTVEAYEALVTLGKYKDSAEKAEALHEKYPFECCAVGDYITFGAYEQDNNTSNGKEDIEWLVLDKKDGKALVISKNALDCQQYNTSYTDVTWETCSLRTWLNGTFLNAAFSEDETARIPTITVSADKNPNYSTNPGNATQDKVFLLSITEANKYFSSDSARQCTVTAYAKTQGAFVNSSNGNCLWYLRSPGYFQNYDAYVNYDGGVIENGHRVDIDYGAVRPAMWIDLS